MYLGFRSGDETAGKAYWNMVQRKRIFFAEDIFIQHIRILDGYHTRNSGDGETKKRINTALKVPKKIIYSPFAVDEWSL